MSGDHLERLEAMLGHLEEISRRAEHSRPGDYRTKSQITADFMRQSVDPDKLRGDLRAALDELKGLRAERHDIDTCPWCVYDRDDGGCICPWWCGHADCHFKSAAPQQPERGTGKPQSTRQPIQGSGYTPLQLLGVVEDAPEQLERGGES